MGTEKRERQKAGRQARLEAAHAAQRRAQLKRRITIGVVIVVVVLGAALVYSLVSGGDDDSTAGSTEAPDNRDDLLVLEAPAPGETLTGETPCPAADGSSPRTTSFESPPPMCIDPSRGYTATVSTTKGEFTITLDPATAPLTTNNFVVLSRYHYYDGAPFHRIIPGFVVQGGDAVGSPLGTGNPGYQFVDELPTAEPFYPLGSVAMANSGPNTNGSQFFIVVGPNGEALNPGFSRFGTVTEGFDVVEAIAAVGTPDVGTPTEEVLIESVTITET